MSPLDRYQQDLLREGFIKDASQAAAVERLQGLYERLVAAEATKPSLLSRLGRKLGGGSITPEKGLYFWGGVGRGKTYLMDAFYDSLPFDRKLRAHFHRFMCRVHAELKKLPGVSDPLEQVASNIARQTRVICFDEFFVSDITDAMILSTLFQSLFDRGVTLVATSNIVPDDLYKEGLQRERFLPAIALLNEHTEVFNLDGGIDYRLRALEKAELYHFPLDEAADESLMRSLVSLAPESPIANQTLEIASRPIVARYTADDVAWFEFKELCDGPRSQTDYIELARVYHAILLSNVPAMGVKNDDQVRRFIHLIDEFYDRNVKLVISAERPLLELYDGGRLDFEFERTTSRLLEMQSHDYLALEHKP